MNENASLKLLVELQDKDSRITLVEDKKKSLPLLIASLHAPLKSAQDSLAEVSSKLEKTETDRRSLERDLKDTEEKIRKLKGRTSEIKTNKEYQALLKEIEQGEAEKSAVEEKVLLLLEEIDQFRNGLSSIKIDVQEKEKSFQAEKEKVEKEFQEMERQGEILKKEKESILPNIDPHFLSEYQRLLATKRGPVVVPLQENHCSGCHMNIPPQLFTEIKKNDKILNCLSCQRILYWKD